MIQLFTSALIIIWLVSPSSSTAQEVAPYPLPPSDISWSTKLVSKDEPGERLIISGTVYKSDERTPFRDLVFYLYQTDSSGVYNMTNRSWKQPRIHGWVRTDQNGKYEIHTIKPGSYPGSKNPAHIHVIVKLPHEQPKWIDDFLFEGDPYLTDSDYRDGANKGKFSYIMKMTKDSTGVIRCTREINLHVK